MRVLVCGGRDYFDTAEMGRILNKLALVIKIDIIIEGEASGADTLAREWAEANAIPFDPYPANWDRKPDGSYDRSAGPKRNQRMLDKGKPDLVVAFPTPKSSGTWDMVGRARLAEVPTWIMPADESKIDATGEGVFA